MFLWVIFYIFQFPNHQGSNFVRNFLKCLTPEALLIFLKIFYQFLPDIYVCCMSHTNSVTPRAKYLAIVSTKIETNDPSSELQPGLNLLGKIDKKFVWISDMYMPKDDGKESKVCSHYASSSSYGLFSCFIKDTI